MSKIKFSRVRVNTHLWNVEEFSGGWLGQTPTKQWPQLQERIPPCILLSRSSNINHLGATEIVTKPASNDVFFVKCMLFF